MSMPFARTSYYRLLALLDWRVKYAGWAAKSETEFDTFVKKRLQHPAKAQALEWLAGETLLGPTFSLLDVGCGPGVLAHLIASHRVLATRVTYEGADQSAAALRHLSSSFPHYRVHHRDVLREGLPEQHYDVIAVNQVVEHMPSYKAIVDMAIAKRPTIFLLTTFAVLSDVPRDRRMWDPSRACYMNTYASSGLYRYLRRHTNAELLIYDHGVEEFAGRAWFPRKSLMVWYLRLGAGEPQAHVERRAS